MATTTFTCNKDARIALSGGTSLGAGASNYVPVGLYSGYLYRGLFGFSYSFAGMVSITNAVFKMKTSSQYYVAFGSDPDIEVYRITSSWSEGTAVSLSGSNAVEWSNQPSVDATVSTLDVSTAENTWVSVNVTTQMQEALAAGVFYGLHVRAADETIASDVTEFYAREYGANDAYIEITYTTNVAPNAPVSLSPTGLAIVGLTPTISFTHSDNDGDALLDYDLQVSTDSTFASVTHWNIAAQTTGIVGNDVDRTYAGTALSRGTTYYWRARTSASAGVLTEGAWTAAQSFKVAQLPTATLTEPSAANRLLRTTYTAGAGWASPRLYVTWSFSCADAGTQYSYEVDVANDSAGTPGSSLYASGAVVSTAQALTVPADLTEGNKYHVRVRVVCSHGETSSYSGYFIGRARWGVALHRFDCGSAPTSWSISTLNTTTLSTNAVVVEYGSNSTTTTPGTFYSSLGSAALNRYFFYRVYLLSWGASPATSASLDRLVLSYSSNVLVPDKWTRGTPAQMTIDEATYVYGTQSLKITRDGTDLICYQAVPVVPNTNYILSGRIKSLNNSQARLQIVNAAHSAVLAETDAVAATQDFTRIQTPIWNSGANTSCIIRCNVGTSAVAGSAAWFDALKLEASTVVTPWSPGFLGAAVVLDAGGLQIDASAGGIFRLRGSSGGTRDRVDLGANGLQFGGDTDLYSSSANELKTEHFNATGYLAIGTFLKAGGNSFPASPVTDDRYYRTDLMMEFVYDGTRWLCTCPHEVPMVFRLTESYADTTPSAYRVGVPYLTASGVYIDDWVCNYYVGTGTALSGSHKWVATLVGGGLDGAADSSAYGTLTVDSGALNQFHRQVVAIDTVVDLDGYAVLIINLTKTGTPGIIYIWPIVRYRHIAV